MIYNPTARFNMGWLNDTLSILNDRINVLEAEHESAVDAFEDGFAAGEKRATEHFDDEFSDEEITAYQNGYVAGEQMALINLKATGYGKQPAPDHLTDALASTFNQGYSSLNTDRELAKAVAHTKIYVLEKQIEVIKAAAGIEDEENTFTFEIDKDDTLCENLIELVTDFISESYAKGSNWANIHHSIHTWFVNGWIKDNAGEIA